MTERSGYIYRIISPCGRCYIGFTTKSLAHRLRDHGYAARPVRGINGPLQEAIRQHGIDKMRIELLEKLPYSRLSVAEQAAILKYDTMWPNGLNASEGGNGGARLIPNSEIVRVKKMKATMATREYKQKARAIQKAVWTEERKAARAEEVRKMWEDPDYRARQMVSRVRPRKPQKQLRLKSAPGEAAKRYWANPEWRAKHLAAHTIAMADPGHRARVAETQRRIMQERPELRRQIAINQFKYRAYTFRKSCVDVVSRKSSVMTRTWAVLPDIITGIDLMDAKWRCTEIDRALKRGWLIVQSDGTDV